MRKELMETEVRRQGHPAVVDVRGEIIGHTGPLLKKAIREAMGQERDVLVNLQAVESMDSSGLAALIDVVRQSHPATIHFFGCTNRVRRLFELTGLDEIFDIHASEDEAMAHAAHSGAAAGRHHQSTTAPSSGA